MKEYEIIWKGNSNTNKSTRRGYAPRIIVDHITEGSASSALCWFTSSGNKVSSAHFLVTKAGEIYQFVKIEDNAWANGINSKDIKNATASMVKEMNVNPNWYSISIEHEGIYKQTKGELTEEQLKATIWLHQYIIDYVKDKWNIEIPVDRKHIIGHYEISPRRKPNCPGQKYPFNQIIESLNNKTTEYINVPQWQIDGFNGLIERDVIQSPEYWKNKLGQPITVGELFAVLNKAIRK
ncbi:hypothetical protein SH1V18_03210 [Vallitalea longa]|uniref:N-acetylmuramoyl-L-alanine amidase n=1 Tax=Vallitalea longa TaxID=2936439 RepID=A0A9W6DD05_9FIRM|nr:peptidoglycan recognition family protein [Vallitalea longa]GKX27841.1 hypothetical protein SH1V18_03210 [Vallitalea longa]